MVQKFNIFRIALKNNFKTIVLDTPYRKYFYVNKCK